MNADRWQGFARAFLFVSYALAPPVFAIVEARTGIFSERFAYPPAFLYFVSATQFVCAFGLLRRALAPWSIVVLTVLSLGAVYAHFRIDSPLTSIPALVYTAVQVWYGLRLFARQDADPES
jgi:hypothetical protein